MTTVRHRVFEITKSIAEFKEHHEFGWEVVEGAFIAAALGLAVLGRIMGKHFEELEAHLTVASHIVVAAVLVMHWGALLSVRHYARSVDHSGTTEGMSFAGIGSDFIADLESWARECEIFKPLNPASVSFATFEDVATLHDCTRVLDRIADRSNFLIDKRAALYRRWLYSRQSVLAGLKDDSGKVVCASVVLPLTEDAYGRLSSGALDAIDIESWDIESNSAAGVGHRYLLIDAVARLDEARKGLGTRLAIYHCSQFFDPKRPPIIVSSTKVDWLQKFFAYLEFTSERDKRDGDIVNYSTDLAQPNPASNPGAPEFRASLLSLLSGYKGPATG